MPVIWSFETVTTIGRPLDSLCPIHCCLVLSVRHGTTHLVKGSHPKSVYRARDGISDSLFRPLVFVNAFLTRKELQLFIFSVLTASIRDGNFGS